MSLPGACMNIAVDHRIRRLFVAVQLPVGRALPREDEAFDNVVDFARERIRPLESDEINVTKRLAGPYGVTGGILVLLQQPAEGHEFRDGTAATIHRCMTLQGLHNVFHTVSLGTVGIADLNVLDMQPFVRPSDRERLHGSLRMELQHHLLKTIEARSPAVVMCASRSFDKAGPLECFASLGVGKTMLERSAEHGQPLKVNAFHPSYALNFYPLEPDFRQLLLLEAIHVCRRYIGAWVEDDWMRDLRERCRVSCATRYGIRYPTWRVCWTLLTWPQVKVRRRGNTPRTISKLPPKA